MNLSIGEIKVLLDKQRANYFWIIGLLSGSLLAFVIFTAILAVKVQNTKDCVVEQDDYPAARLEYHVWSHENATLQGTQHSVQKLKVPNNSTLFTVMEHAAALQNDHFKFQIKMHELFGRYIIAIGDFKETNGTFWSLYQLKGTPDPYNPPANSEMTDEGIDSIRVRSGDVYLFWLKKYDSHSANDSKMKELRQQKNSSC